MLEPDIDKLPSERGTLIKKTETLKFILEELGLVDSWRTLNPKVQDYTFYSSVLGTYSRIDMICISKKDMLRVCNINIEPITLFDHGPVRLKINLKTEKYFRYWRLNVNRSGNPNPT